eukprot:m.31797 g.31797  ORF g.31797 m.31797 type:complete len:96 (-) comp9459_c1_seq1:2285-2572(-)
MLQKTNTSQLIWKYGHVTSRLLYVDLKGPSLCVDRVHSLVKSGCIQDMFDCKSCVVHEAPHDLSLYTSERGQHVIVHRATLRWSPNPNFEPFVQL